MKRQPHSCGKHSAPHVFVSVKLSQIPVRKSAWGISDSEFSVYVDVEISFGSGEGGRWEGGREDIYCIILSIIKIN